MFEFPERTLQDYFQSIRRAIDNEDGKDLCRLMSIDLAHRSSFIRILHQQRGDTEIFSAPVWTNLVQLHLNVIRAIHESRIKDAFDEKVNSNNELCKLLETQRDSNWYLSFMTKHSVDLRRLAIKVDMASCDVGYPHAITQSGYTSVSKKDQAMEKACDCLMALFRICVTDTRAAQGLSKRAGIINIINQLFKIYFRINKVHLCKALIRAADSSNVFDQCDLAQKVTYNYYLGIKSLFDLRIPEAEKLLDYAFENCHPESMKNRRLILTFLIPIKMLLGRLPNQKLMDKYDLQQFRGIKQALIAGHIGNLDKAIEEHSEFFWRYGIYLIVERLRPIALRNLFKKVSRLYDTHLIDLDRLLKAVRLVQPDEDISIEEVHCMLASLIYDGKIKGYLSIGHQKLVLSKKDPFPPISELAKNLSG